MNFDVAPSEHEIIVAIAQRANELAATFTISYPVLDAEMDVTATHANGCPLDLAVLLAFDDSDFGHDVFGIRHHIDRSTGVLGGCFLPRCAQPVTS